MKTKEKSPHSFSCSMKRYPRWRIKGRWNFSIPTPAQNRRRPEVYALRAAFNRKFLVPPCLLRAGKVEFLKGIFKSARIYKTPHFLMHYDACISCDGRVTHNKPVIYAWYTLNHVKSEIRNCLNFYHILLCGMDIIIKEDKIIFKWSLLIMDDIENLKL